MGVTVFQVGNVFRVDVAFVSFRTVEVCVWQGVGTFRNGRTAWNVVRSASF